MINNVGDLFSQLNFFDIHRVLLDNYYYDILFPFLLIFAVTYTALSYPKIFRSKKTDKPIKPIIMMIAISISWFSVSFETSPGYTIGNLMMMLFPNISALTIGILGMYITGAILGKDFLRGLFDKNNSAYVYYALGAIGLGSVVYYVGIALGMWNYNPFDTQSYWNVVLGVGFLILGIVFMIIGFWTFGLLLLFVFGAFVYNYGQGNILEYFIDPVVFIILLVISMLSWMGTYKDEKEVLREALRNAEENFTDYRKRYNGRLPHDYESRVFDNISANYEKNKEKWHKKFPGEHW